MVPFRNSHLLLPALQAVCPFLQEYYYANKYYGMSEAEMNTNLDRLRRTDNRSQLKKHLMQTQALQQYNVNLSSGTEKIQPMLR